MHFVVYLVCLYVQKLFFLIITDLKIILLGDQNYSLQVIRLYLYILFWSYFSTCSDFSVVYDVF